MSRVVTITDPDEGSQCFNIISDDGRYLAISPLDDPTTINALIRHSDGHYSVVGTNRPYQIEFQCRTNQPQRRPFQGPNVEFLMKPRSTQNMVSVEHLGPIILRVKEGTELEPEESTSYDVFPEIIKPAYRPVLRSGPTQFDEENILGEPLFLEGDSWPENKSFYAQFWDLDDPQTFIQIFVDDISDEPSGSIRRISRRDLETRRIVHLPKPTDVPNQEVNAKMVREGKAGKIIGWTRLDTIFTGDIDRPEGIDLPEGIDWSYLEEDKTLGTDLDMNIILQLGGVGSSAQGIDYSEEGLYYMNLYNGYYGDAGVIHMDRNGQATGDMY